MMPTDHTYYESLIEKYLTGQLTATEAEELQRYLSERPEIAKGLRRRYNTISLLVAAPREGDMSNGMRSLRQWKKSTKQQQWRKLWMQSIKYAAAVLIIVLGGRIYSEYRTDQVLSQQVTEVAAPTGQRLLFTMNDGTTIHLSPCSKMTFDARYSKGKHRNVRLEGAAFFDVAHNKTAPFKVETKCGYDVVVTGTQFYLQSDQLSPLHLSLLEGGVTLYSARDTVPLTPGESLLLRDGRLVKNFESLSQIANRKVGIVQYKNTPLSQIFAEIGHWYGAEIIFVNEELKDRRLSGKIRQGDSLKSIVEAVCCSLGLRYEMVGEHTIKIGE
ncbi:MAG: FecR domain-containing protein [Porphyromonas sp.]|nr:FecR domain-containing protein [Porphyromonas sp.]